MTAQRWQNQDPERANIEYLAENLAHEFNLAIKDVIEQKGAFVVDTGEIARELGGIAAAINNLAEAIREGRSRDNP